MFRKIFLTIMTVSVSSLAWGDGFEFNVNPTVISVQPVDLAPFVWATGEMCEGAQPVFLSWELIASDNHVTKLELNVTPFASVNVGGHPRAILQNVNGAVVFDGGELEITQENFGSVFAFSVFLQETNRLTFLLPVKMTSGGKGSEASFLTQLLVACTIDETMTTLSCEPPRIAFLEALSEHFPGTPPAEELFQKKLLPLRSHLPSGSNLVSGLHPQLPGGPTDPCCHNMWYTKCKCLMECPIGDCENNCTFCSVGACRDCHDLFNCLNGCS